MYRNVKKILFVVILLSLLAHGIFLLFSTTVHIPLAAYTPFKKPPQKTAQVIFEKPKKAKKPKKKKSPLKKKRMKFASGSANTPKKIQQPPEEKEKQPEKKRPETNNKPKPHSFIKANPLKKKKTQPTTKKITLADITKGFIKKRKPPQKQSMSNHLVTIIGSKPGQATEEQLMHELYIKKLFSCIQTSLSFLQKEFYMQKEPTEATLLISFSITLNQQGRMLSFDIMKSTGDADVDLFVEKILDHASRSFPPVPSSLATDYYIVPCCWDVPVAWLARPTKKNKFA